MALCREHVRTLIRTQPKNNWERVVHSYSQCPRALRLTEKSHTQQQFEAFQYFHQCCSAQKHCNIFARCSDGIYVHNDFEISSKWTGISQIMKKDFVPVDAYVSPLKREQNYTLLLYMSLPALNTIEGESIWPKK